MRAYAHRLFAGLFLCCLFAASANAEDFGRYVIGNDKTLPDLPLSYDPTLVHFQRAPAAMVETDFEDGADWGFVDASGKAFIRPLDLTEVPFWIYATYESRDSHGTCRYALIDGLVPSLYKNIPAEGKVSVVESDANAAVVRDCGNGGFELVSRESYDSALYYPYKSAYLAHLGGPQISDDTVAKGLARDYVERLLDAFGGPAPLQKKLDEAATRTGSETIAPVLYRALIAAGLRVAPQLEDKTLRNSPIAKPARPSHPANSVPPG
ncbi:MAG TPA: hypothetical protein VGG48_19600 [Rhizomicrobium sp.]